MLKRKKVQLIRYNLLNNGFFIILKVLSTENNSIFKDFYDHVH